MGGILGQGLGKSDLLVFVFVCNLKFEFLVEHAIYSH